MFMKYAEPPTQKPYDVSPLLKLRAFADLFFSLPALAEPSRS
jgi:hypothetical protein